MSLRFTCCCVVAGVACARVDDGSSSRAARAGGVGVARPARGAGDSVAVVAGVARGCKGAHENVHAAKEANVFRMACQIKTVAAVNQIIA